MLVQFLGEVDFICYILLRARSAQKSLDFHKHIYCSSGFYNIWEKYRNCNQSLRTYATVRRKAQTEKKKNMGEQVDQKDISTISFADLWEQALLLLQHNCKL